MKPRLTRKQELQEAARQKVAAVLAQSNVRNRVYGGQSTGGRKAGGPRRSRGTSTSKPTPVQGIEHEGAKTTVKPATSAASNLQEGKYYNLLPSLSSLPPSLLPSLSPPLLSPLRIPLSSWSSCIHPLISRELRLLFCLLFSFYLACPLILLKSKF